MSDAITQRFHSQPVPSFTARTDLRQPIVFSHVASGTAMPRPTLLPPVEDAYSVHVHHLALSRGEMWTGERHRPLPRVSDGGLVIFDMTSEPTAQLHEAFEFSRFHLPRAALDDLAYERGLPRIAGLHAAAFKPDLVVKHLALALLQRVALHGPEGDTLFNDAVMLALFAHIAQTYGGSRAAPMPVGVLLPWQLHRITDWVEANLQRSIAIADLAALLGLSASHFSRVFSKTLRMPPHRWVLRRRIARAKQMLKGSAFSLSDIAACCGFVDQSHFGHVFLRIEGMTPARWRLQSC